MVPRSPMATPARLRLAPARVLRRRASERPAGRSSSELAGQAQQRRERREAAKRTELLAKVNQ